MSVLSFPVERARLSTYRRRQDRRHELLSRCRDLVEDGLGYLKTGDQARAEERMLAALDVKRMTDDIMRLAGIDPITEGYYPESVLMEIYRGQGRLDDALDLLRAVMADYLQDEECTGPAVFWYVQWILYGLKWWRTDKVGGKRILSDAVEIYPEPERVISMIENLGHKSWPDGY